MHFIKRTITLFSFLFTNLSSEYSQDQVFFDNLRRCTKSQEQNICALENAYASDTTEEKINENIFTQGAELNILFTHFPALQKTLSYASCGDFPTPIHHCKNLENEFPQITLHIKNDGITGKKDSSEKRIFGGNKLRKLQYLLAYAKAQGYESVITFGAAGSNHALQTTICGALLGLKTICILRPQANSYVVQQNLLLQKKYNAELYFSQDKERFIHEFMIVASCISHKQRTGKFPYIIPTGGSNARGTIGYVEAAFELKKQINDGLLPRPDRIYVTLGSGGTAAGLLLGLKAAGIKTTLYLVLISPEIIQNTSINRVKNLFTETNALLRSYDESFPQYDLLENDYEVISDCTGQCYGLFTPECMSAIKLLRKYENINLEGTYTGKCFSALIRDITLGKCNKQNVLFWNTFCGEDFSHETEGIDYHSLPKILHHYFETPVQELDR